MNKYYRIYGKPNDAKRFKALDVSNGVFVNNLIYASFWSDETDVKKVLEELKDLNPSVKFEIRKVSKS